MKLTKLWMVLALAGILFSCSEEDTIIDNPDSVEALDLVADLSTYQNSPLGLYKGVFSTTDSQQRGVVEIKVINEEVARANIRYIDGTIEGFRGKIVQQDLSMKISFLGRSSSFDLEVGQDGSNPTVSNANSNSKASLITVVKENTRGAVTPLTGSFESSVGSTGTWSIIFNSGSDEGDNTDITTQSIFDSIDYGSATGNSQTNCMTVDNVTTCDVGGTYVSLGIDISWTGVHTFLGAPDCSSSIGTWTATGAVTSTGTYQTDLICTAPGNFIETAIPITPAAEGTGCAVPGFVVNVEDDGYSSSGIDNAACGETLSTGADIFYSWTSTTDALFFNAEPGDADEDIIIRDSAGIFIACASGSNFGGTTLSGWMIGDDLIIQIIGSGDATASFCLEEATIPGAPANDLCMNATPIACGESDTGSTLTATDETGITGNDVFYSFTNSGMLDQDVTVSLCGSAYDTRVRILDGCGGTQIAQNDDNFTACGPGGNSEVTFVATSGESYIIVVEAFDDESGSYSIAVSCVDILPPPGLSCGDNYIDDGGVDADYSVNQSLEQTVTADPGETVTFTFSQFDLENTWDHMRFFDGSDSTAPEITMSVGGASTTFTNVDRQGFTGTSLDGDSVTSTGNQLTVFFQSDGTVTAPGYQAVISCDTGMMTRGQQQTMTLQERNARPELSLERQLELKMEAFEKYNNR